MNERMNVLPRYHPLETLKRSHDYIIAAGDQMYLSFGIVATEVLAVEQRCYVAQKVRASPSWI
jgi:hypothetical protein